MEWFYFQACNQNVGCKGKENEPGKKYQQTNLVSERGRKLERKKEKVREREREKEDRDNFVS